VQALQRLSVGGLGLGDLAPGAWRPLASADIARIFA
jgi:16S rRNA U516 pseudouridylate synthase RsuA-like enzyme